MTEQLFEEYKPIVYYCYRKLQKCKFILDYQEDLLQEGFLALWKGLITYKEEYGVTLSTYLFPCVRNALYNYLRDNEAYFKYDINESLSTPINEDGDTLEDVIPDPKSLQDPEDIEGLIDSILEIYKKYLRHKNKSCKIDLRLCRARIILETFIDEGHIGGRYIEDKYCIGRTLVHTIVKELREALKDYKEVLLYNGRK